ncbi:hypothetical protein BS47DRAFT_1394843 [Hydnum rufescens UP504]|uniref:Uncharacterized protein n=1 Tax=Hydnum rufescens UP504 TaxID=1448309 RepID=A0A9P6DS40_9AGAM|nr:hypothetical protein BS47DRAFT_1394843 [Hydnum rufescens UP504]
MKIMKRVFNSSLIKPFSFKDPNHSALANQNLPFRYLNPVVSIDFGRMHSGVSYVISNPGFGETRQILAWPGSNASSKIPTCLVYDAVGDIRSWGLEATDIGSKNGFKLWLHPSSAPRPVLESRFFQVLSSAFKFQRDQSLTICDAGGVSVDLATYTILGASGAPEIADAAPRSRSYSRSGTSRCSPGSSGSGKPSALRVGGQLTKVSWKYGNALSALAVEPAVSSSAIYRPQTPIYIYGTYSVYAADLYPIRRPRLSTLRREDDIKLLRFRCLHAEDLHDPSAVLGHGELVIPRDVLRCGVFDPIVEQVLYSIAAHVRASKVPLDKLLLFGGFSTNEYLFQRITEQFSSSVVSAVRLADRYPVSCRWWGSIRHRHPRLFWSILLSGPRSPLSIIQIYIFELVLYTSNGDQLRRYFDQEEGEELCRSRVDLRTYPSFLERVEASPFGNFASIAQVRRSPASATNATGLMLFFIGAQGFDVFSFTRGRNMEVSLVIVANVAPLLCNAPSRC